MPFKLVRTDGTKLVTQTWTTKKKAEDYKKKLNKRLGGQLGNVKVVKTTKKKKSRSSRTGISRFIM